jgi:hypothetical protein
MQRFAWVFFASLAILAVLQPAEGDVFVLRSGGRIEGDLVNSDEQPRTSYVISLPGGGQLTLDAAVVAKVESVPQELAEYEKVRRQHPNTVQGQLQMADWCHKHKLDAQWKTHLERVLQLDPDQADARRLLGYRKVDDQWMTKEEEMAAQGKVKRVISGSTRWLTHQEAEVLDGIIKRHDAEQEWVGKISRWRKWLNGTQSELGEKNLRAITDPMAIHGLADKLVKDDSYKARQIYVEVLAHFDTHQARGPLAKCAIDDSLEEVRLTCLDELAKQKDEMVVAYFVGRMRDKHASNETINRAGVALGRMKDPSCIPTLIQYLVTGHEEVVQPAAGGPGAMNAAFNKKGGPGGGLAMNQKPQTFTHWLQNQGVLDALVAITGQPFGFDTRAWNTWYLNQKAKGAPVEANK